jgi:hypothetical protein
MPAPLVDITANPDGTVDLTGHQVLLHWDKVRGSDAYWHCTCGATSPIVPMSGGLLKASLTHQAEHTEAFAKACAALEALR